MQHGSRQLGSALCLRARPLTAAFVCYQAMQQASMAPTLHWLQAMRWWQALGQNINIDGVRLFAHIMMGHQDLAMPHVSVPDIRWVDWQALRAAGFQGCVFDKDNTMTEPYAAGVQPRLAASLERCRSAFDGRLVLLSNSAGLTQFDPEGTAAAELEQSLHIPVLRHSTKKPAGDATDLERHFGCPAEQLVLVGDRYLTDVVYGNRNGLLTIRPSPLTLSGEPGSVVLVGCMAHLAASCVACWAGVVDHRSPP